MNYIRLKYCLTAQKERSRIHCNSIRLSLILENIYVKNNFD